MRRIRNHHRGDTTKLSSEEMTSRHVLIDWTREHAHGGNSGIIKMVQIKKSAWNVSQFVSSDIDQHYNVSDRDILYWTTLPSKIKNVHKTSLYLECGTCGSLLELDTDRVTYVTRGRLANILNHLDHTMKSYFYWY